MKWVKATDQLPKQKGLYYLKLKDGGMQLGGFDGIEFDPVTIPYLDIVEWLDESNGWISVKEKTPKDMERVIVCLRDSYVKDGIYDAGSGRWYGDRGQLFGITHWQNLPNPPKQEQP